MANPKRRQSKQRTRNRRTHHKAVAAAPFVDGISGVEHVSHQVCSETGFYRGKQVLTIKPKTKKIN